MADEEVPTPVAPGEATVETVDDNDDGEVASAGAEGTTAESAMETARAQAEARRKRILEKANNRMKYVNGEQVQDEEEKKTSLSNAARIRAARQRRYGRKSASAASATPAPAPSATTTAALEISETESKPYESTESSAPEVSASASTPETAAEPSKEEPADNKEKILEAPGEETAAVDDAPPAAPAAGSTGKKKYVGVARMRRKMLAKKKMEEESNSDQGASSSAADSPSAKASLASDGKSSKGVSDVGSKSTEKVGTPPMKAQTVPIYMHMIVILLLFVAGFDVGIQQFHVDIDVRTQVAVQEFGVPLLHRNPWNPLEPIASETLEEKALTSSSSSSTTGDVKDEFDETIDEEYNPPNIDPIFRVDFDEMTKGSGFFNQLARGAIGIHRLILWILYYGPMGFFGSILSIPATLIKSPPGLFSIAIILRQVVGHGVLGAEIPDESGEDGTDGTKQNNIEVLSMAKNFVKNFFVTTFPTAVKFYDAYLHLKSDMYVVFCGVFFGLAWSHLKNDALSCDADAIMGGGDASEGEL